MSTISVSYCAVARHSDWRLRGHVRRSVSLPRGACSRLLSCSAPVTKRPVHLQLSKAQYEAAFGNQPQPSGDAVGEAVAEQSAPVAAEQPTGGIIGEVDLEVFYNDGNKARTRNVSERCQ